MTLAATEQLPAVRQQPAPVRVTPINEPIDRNDVGAIQVRNAQGGLSFNNMIELMDFAKLMAVSQTAVPKHLRGNPGACMAICMNAVEWRMSPFAVANKSYCVNDRIVYEAGMYQAVVSRRAPIKGRIKMSFSGEGDSRVCTVSAELADGSGPVEYESPKFGRIQPKNSPLWKNDPDQQLFYFSVRAWARRHFQDVMMGVYTVDEMQDNPPEIEAQAAALDNRIANARAARAAKAPAYETAAAGNEGSFVDPQREDSQVEPETTGSTSNPSPDDDQRTPEVPDIPDTHEQAVDYVASLCGVSMETADKLIKLNAGAWAGARKGKRVEFWDRLHKGLIDGLKPKQVTV